jgi:ribosome-binding factor A
MLKVINEVIKNEVKDPRIGFVTITRLELTENLRFARVYVSVMGSDDERAQSFKGIKSATSFIRSRLGKNMRIKKMPELNFVLDHGQEDSDRINRLMHQLETEDAPRGSDEGIN